MIIIRYENAKPLNSIFKLENDPYYFANLIMKSGELNLIYFDNGIVVKRARKEKPTMFRLIGELERENKQFILLIDKKCSIFDPVNKDLTVVNAKCLTQELLDSHFDQSNTSVKDKNKLFNALFHEFIDDNTDVVFKDAVEWFARAAASDNLIKKESLFIVMSTKNGTIYNTTGSLGKAYNEGKIWFFNEDYDYNPDEIDKPVPAEKPASTINVVEKFCEEYENYDRMSLKDLLGLNREELEEIVRKYPTLFSDLIRSGYSYFDGTGNAEYIERFSVDEEDDDDEEEFDIADYYEESSRAPMGYRMCYHCQEYVPIGETEDISIGDNMVKLCTKCYPESGVSADNRGHLTTDKERTGDNPNENLANKARMCHQCHEFCSILTATQVLTKGIRVWVCQQCYRAEMNAI